MKRLLIVSDSFLPRVDGVARFLSDIIPHLTKRFSVTVIAPSYKGEFKEPENCRIYRVPIRGILLGDYQPPKKDVRLIVECIEESELIWTQTIGPLGSFAIKKANELDKKVVAYIHSVEWELFSKGLAKTNVLRSPIEKITRVFARKVYRKCKTLFVPSRHVKESLESIGIKRQMKILPLGVDSKSFFPAKDKDLAKKELGFEGRNVIGYLGRIGKEKDIFTLVKAFKNLEGKNSLLIVGSGNKMVEAKIRGENIIKVGSVENVLKYLHAMDIYVLPSLTETSSLSTMEAMACEIPVVCTPVGLIQDYVKEGINGFLFGVGDIEKLSEILKRLINDRDLRKRIGKRARKTIMKYYDWNKSVKAIIDALELI